MKTVGKRWLLWWTQENVLMIGRWTTPLVPFFLVFLVVLSTPKPTHGWIVSTRSSSSLSSSFSTVPLARLSSLRMRMTATDTMNAATTTTTTIEVATMTTASDNDDEIDERYDRAARASHSFETHDFSPAWFATNTHIQTILAALYRKETMYYVGSRSSNNNNDVWSVLMGRTKEQQQQQQQQQRRQRRPLDDFAWDERQRFWTDDGDFYDVDWKYTSIASSSSSSSSSKTNPVVVVCHGLETNSNSPLAQDMAIAFANVGMDTACINFRGCSGELNLTPRSYHLGFYDDLLHQIQTIHTQHPQRPIYLSGFSLGAGVVTKMLAELGAKAYEYNIAGAAVNAVPMDCTQSSPTLNKDGLSKRIYGQRLLKSMQSRLREQYDKCDFPFDKEDIDQCQSIMDFENLLIAPTFGFEDAWDYYRKCKTIDVLDRVAVPELIVQALDDPFFKGVDNPDNNPNIPVNIQYTKYGGHCGYVFQTKNPQSSVASWMPTQLARFLSYIEARRKKASKEEVDDKERSKVDVVR